MFDSNNDLAIIQLCNQAKDECKWVPEENEVLSCMCHVHAGIKEISLIWYIDQYKGF